jgi:RNA recognition motif-containing protein
MSMKLYVGNIDFQTSEYDLEQLFGESGTVTSANIINDRETGRSRGFGFVEMSSQDEGEAAIAALNGKEHNGRALVVNAARERESRSNDRNNNGGNQGGRGGYGGRNNRW